MKNFEKIFEDSVKYYDIYYDDESKILKETLSSKSILSCINYV